MKVGRAKITARSNLIPKLPVRRVLDKSGSCTPPTVRNRRNVVSAVRANRVNWS